MPVQCAWCRAVLREGTGPVSHGICDSCLEKHFPEEVPLDALRARFITPRTLKALAQ